MARFILTASLSALLSACATARPTLGAEVRLQEQALLTRTADVLESAVGDAAAVATSSLRLKAEGTARAWSYDLHYLLRGVYSQEFSGWARLTPPSPNPDLLHLEHDIAHGRYGDLAHRLDRASIAYSTPHTVSRVGRQALTWGHGQVFQPLDLFNPFSPDAQDRSYKPGADMAYAQYLFDSGADVQAILVPRRRANGHLAADASSAAVKGVWQKGGVELEGVAGSDFGDPVFAVGSAGPLGGAAWKFDVVSTHPKGSDAVFSAVASVQNSWSWRTRPVSAFVEYYRNGFGVTGRPTVDALPANLTHRVARGQLFATSRDYADIGATVNWTALLQVAPVGVVNLNDRSVLALVTAHYSLSDNANLVVGAQLPLGGRGSEFGGLRATATADQFERAPSTFFVRFERFF
ncbi:MAG: hypothetical protein R2708_29040 [Vicinamibacterales bacterium]